MSEILDGTGHSAHAETGPETGTGAMFRTEPAGTEKNEVWTLAETREGRLTQVSFELLARGRPLADNLAVPLVSIVVGEPLEDRVLEELVERGADRVIAVLSPALDAFVAGTWTRILTRLIAERRPQILLAAATSSGRTVMPCLAVKVHAGLTADCTDLDIEEGTGNLLQTRPAIGGNIMATIKTPGHRPQMATVRPKSMHPLCRDPERRGEILRRLPDSSDFDSRVRVEGIRVAEGGSASIEEADIIIAGGRGLKKADNFRMLERLAATLGGVVGASREAVDRGWIPYPHQIGLSGKTVSPKLYVGIGISGAIQHLAGIKTAEAIISINSDPDAALHKVADLAVVGDAFRIIPELQRSLDAKVAVAAHAEEGDGLAGASHPESGPDREADQVRDTVNADPGQPGQGSSIVRQKQEVPE